MLRCKNTPAANDSAIYILRHVESITFKKMNLFCKFDEISTYFMTG